MPIHLSLSPKNHNLQRDKHLANPTFEPKWELAAEKEAEEGAIPLVARILPLLVEALQREELDAQIPMEILTWTVEDVAERELQIPTPNPHVQAPDSRATPVALQEQLRQLSDI